MAGALVLQRLRPYSLLTVSITSSASMPSPVIPHPSCLGGLPCTPQGCQCLARPLQWADAEAASTSTAAAAAALSGAIGQPWAPAPPHHRAHSTSSSSFGISLPSPLKLADLMKLEALQDHGAQQIEDIWMEVSMGEVLQSSSIHSPNVCTITSGGV
jgi:hypothetical protein